MAEWTTGTVIWINLDSKKDPDWQKYMLSQSVAGEAFQTYLIHNNRVCHHTKPELWGRYQSNVHGVFIATRIVPKVMIHAYPRRVETIIELFIPGIKVTEKDFGPTT